MTIFDEVTALRSDLTEILNDTVKLFEEGMIASDLASLLKRACTNTSKIACHFIHGRIDDMTVEIAEDNLLMIEHVARCCIPNILSEFQNPSGVVKA